ncbi:hypothetical protein TST_0304 [Thermosulfidibacter takaii ABI70S6]|uniref:Nucleoside 2-deoxyribosyltransferase n=1 Tax=Thermosulfidibacter takaii (strain DSM 17441 / JCM 13301 / NBRC 103674 / ABI70S6) TaxID=1298851 RepID=A0A0S3QS11_THET7|nr:hypothetical protein [Thermosulfidibacter takaii]BAT71112.1 hypothetical protein TST_0304 [Thermosulfidibacter takaii ABI70S6]
MKKRIFIAGIIQGSKVGKSIHSQDYRERLKKTLAEYFLDWEIYCPVTNHPNSVEYTDEEATKTFLYHVDLVKHSGLVVAYLPEASMGTAIEMWEAYKSGVPVWTITPMKENWVVRITSQRIFGSIEELEDYLAAGGRING